MKNLTKRLEEIRKKMDGPTVSVGFQDGATYPDGTIVAAVAYTNEFGVPSQNQPPRPFFRQAIKAESPTWGKKMSALVEQTNFDGAQILGIIGEDVKGAVTQSINQLKSPPLHPYTIQKKGFDKPLIDTAVMVRSITSKVDSE